MGVPFAQPEGTACPQCGAMGWVWPCSECGFKPVPTKVGKPQLMPTGLALWQLPNSMFQIMWPGPGSRLLFGTLTKPDGLMIHIEHPTANGAYATLREAQAAVEAFSAAAEAR